MEYWYSKPLGDGMWAPIACAEIEEKFQPLFESTGKPVSMAVFVRHDEGDVQCEVTSFFSPAAAEVAKMVEANPCGKPIQEGLNLLAGSEDCWSALFGNV